uniref:Uncharacterized protein n=1 Tax=Arundo donax TaxID=35708 RepID=A0A0A9AJL2_ARUDO
MIHEPTQSRRVLYFVSITRTFEIHNKIGLIRQHDKVASLTNTN